jgi:UDP-2,3-diacylglucosamine hydrolase
LFLLQPLWLRRAEIERGRGVSERAKQVQQAEIMDVTASAVEQAFRDSGCTRMIHGHTHRPGRHVHLVDGRSCERWVLSDWYRHGQYLLVGPDGCNSVELA